MPHPHRHRAHDFAFLLKRWNRVARRSGLTLSRICEASGHPIIALSNRIGGGHSLYLSAGIHGDEPASTEGLIEWAEGATAFLRKTNIVIFPCLNPWGLINNSRLDASGRDLNRSYQSHRIPQIVAHKRFLMGWHFDIAMCLHEDFDAHGVYLYEVKGSRPFLGERLLAAAARHLPIDTRRSIEGRPARNGVIRRKIPPELIEERPEALFLNAGLATRTFTLETPSEASLHDRVDAHCAVLRMTAASLRHQG